MKIRRFWLVRSESGGMPTAKYLTAVDAGVEAERQARNNRGKTFIVFEAMRSVCAADVAWADTVDDSEG
jgi:hypothetical protein